MTHDPRDVIIAGMAEIFETIVMPPLEIQEDRIAQALAQHALTKYRSQIQAARNAVRAAPVEKIG